MKTARSSFLPLAALAVLLLAAAARGEGVRELRIDPATATVAGGLGKAHLTVEPLVRGEEGKGKGEGLHAGYKVEVKPISVGEEEGTLTVAISDDALRRLADGHAIEFTGEAVSTDGDTSSVQGTATPAGNKKDEGTIQVRIDGKKGKLVFETTYHLVK